MMEILIDLIELFGAVFIAWAALSVHHKVLTEHRIDDQVIKVMAAERRLGLFGVFLIILSFVLRLFWHLNIL